MDDIKYKIVGFDKAIGQIIVEFENWHPMPIDLHLTDDGIYPTGEELDALIKRYYPRGNIERKLAHEAGISNAHEIEALVQPSEYYSELMPTADDLFSVLK